MELLEKRIAELSPTKLAILEKKLKKKKHESSDALANFRSGAGSQDKYVPLSFSQERLWFLEQMDPNSCIYNLPAILPLPVLVNPSYVKDSLLQIVARHNALRTRFVVKDDVPYQLISEEAESSLDFSVLDISDGDDIKSDSSTLLSALISKETWVAFDLACSPLLRVRLILNPGHENILLLVMHHIISDGWSINLLLNEFRTLYEAACLGKPSALPPLSHQYTDFTRFQRISLKGKRLQSLLSYWRTQLEEAPSLLNLPTDYPRPARQSFNGAMYSFNVPLPTLQKIKSFCSQSGVVPFMALLSVFNILLYRYTQQSKIVVGSPIANRNQSEFEAVIGFFANTLVLCSTMTGNVSFRELLAQVRQLTLGAYEHQEIPFEKLVAELQPARSLSYNPIFQVMFIFQNLPKEKSAAAETNQEPNPHSNQLDFNVKLSKFDLSLAMTEVEDGLSAVFEYATDLFAADTIERMSSHFLNILDYVITNPDAPVNGFSFLSSAEQTKIIAQWNDTEHHWAEILPLHHRFERWASKTPGIPAVIFQGESLSYQELDRRANHVAKLLLCEGVQPDAVIAISALRSLELVVGLLGILKAGAAYLPIEPDFPEERITYMLEDAEVKIVMTTADSLPLLSTLSNLKLTNINLDEIKSRISNSDDKVPPVALTDRHLAYVLYTSGTTGQPKGVMISHGAIDNRLQWMQAEYQLTTADRVMQKTPFTFDVSVWEFFWPLSEGACLVLAEPERHKESAYLLELIQQQQVTCLHFVPSMLQLFLHEDVSDCVSLKRIICSGEALSIELCQRLQALPQVSAHNLYGPTEAAVDVTHWDCGQWRDQYSSIPIGKPIANTQIYILNEKYQPSPIGVPGEIYIGGHGLARGYINKPKLTEKQFVNNPFSLDPVAKLYKTGDLGCFRKDGNIEYIGRLDSQIKLRGVRIELGEIENHLREYPGVAEAVAVLNRFGDNDERLAAYVVPKGGSNEEEKKNNASSLDSAAITAWIKKKMPAYMVPATIISLNELPLSANGKLDRKRLPIVSTTKKVTESTQPVSDIEEKLIGIWCKTLKLDRISIYDDFFELGGHSLLATQLVSRIREIFSLELPIRTLFEHQTVKSLARAVEQAQEIKDQEILPMDVISRQQPLPLSHAQQRLWFLHQLMGANPVYNIPFSQSFQSDLDVDALLQSLETILARHEALRTRFESREEVAVQIIDPLEITLVLERVTWDELITIQRAERTYLFDLAKDRLCRIRLLNEQSTGAYVLLVTMHHIISDGWSMEIFARELKTLYQAYSKGDPSPLSPLALQYADFAHWQRQWLSGKVLQRQVDYWKQQLAGLPPLLTLPTDRPRPAQQSFQGSFQLFTIPEDLSKKLHALSRKQGATLFMTLLSGFAILLSRYSNQQDIAIGTPIANRVRGETEELIGFFVNTLVMRGDLSGDPHFVELLQRIKEVALQGYDHQDVPFELLVEKLNPPRSLSNTPLFQVMFALQNVPLQDLSGSDLELFKQRVDKKQTVEKKKNKPNSSDKEDGVARFDLTLTMIETPEGLSGGMEYNTDLFNQETIDRLLCHYERLLEKIVESPKDRISRYVLLSEGESQQQLLKWNATQRYYPENKCLHELFEEQVERSPNAMALVYETQQLSYRELNNRANQLAHYLISLGVSPDTCVGLCLQRSLEMVIGILSIIKAGGAYVPIDPGYPQQRIEFILENSAVDIVLSQSHLLGLFANGQQQVLILDMEEGSHTETDLFSNQSTANLPVEYIGLSANHLAYVIYTSGSTGKPKGVVIEHRSVNNLANNLFELLPSPQQQEEKRWGWNASFCFDASVQGLTQMMMGTTLVIIPEAVRLEPEALMAFLAQQSISCWDCTPAQLLTVLSMDTDELKLPTTIIGGEAIGNEMWRKLIALNERYGTILMNVYGPTECCVNTTLCQIIKNHERESLGKWLGNVKGYVLSITSDLVPIGVPGELFIGGDGVARGYLNNEVLTQEKFIQNPFSDDPEDRLYRSGDLVRWLGDGTLEFIERIDEQVKIRGFRIELGEIESVLCQHPQVNDAVVLARQDEVEAQSKQLVAYVVLQDVKASATQKLKKKGSETETKFNDPEELLRTHMQDRLPAYMVPSFIIVLEALPLTTNGKIDRKALPAPDRSLQQAEYVVPEGIIEEQLAGLWSEVLRLERVGRYDNFFELGGHSILAIKVINSINKHYQLNVPVRLLFENLTIKSLANALNSYESEAWLDDSKIISAMFMRSSRRLLLTLDQLSEVQIDDYLQQHIDDPLITELLQSDSLLKAINSKSEAAETAIADAGTADEIKVKVEIKTEKVTAIKNSEPFFDPTAMGLSLAYLNCLAEFIRLKSDKEDLYIKQVISKLASTSDEEIEDSIVSLQLEANQVYVNYMLEVRKLWFESSNVRLSPVELEQFNCQLIEIVNLISQLNSV